MSHWRLPQQLVGQPPPLAAGSLVFSPLRKAKGGKLGAQGAGRLCRRQGALRGHLEVWASCHRLPPTVTPEPQTSPCRHSLWAPQHHTGKHTHTHTQGYHGLALPLPAALASQACLGPHSPRAHKVFQAGPGDSEEAHVGHGEAMDGSSSFWGSGLSKDVAARDRKRPE